MKILFSSNAKKTFDKGDRISYIHLVARGDAESRKGATMYISEAHFNELYREIEDKVFSASVVISERIDGLSDLLELVTKIQDLDGLCRFWVRDEIAPAISSPVLEMAEKAFDILPAIRREIDKANDEMESLPTL